MCERVNLRHDNRVGERVDAVRVDKGNLVVSKANLILISP